MAQAQQLDDRLMRFQDALRTSVSQTAWHTWLARLEADLDQEGLILTAPNEFHLRWVLDKHGETIEQAFLSAFGDDAQLSYEAGEGESIQLNSDEAPSLGDPPSQEMTTVAPASDTASKADPFVKSTRKYRFDTFVVGQSNRFAWAAAMAVAEQPGTNYNPLFIYGAAGLGKTHLLNAIGHHALEMYPGLTMRYVSSETFFTEFIDGIRRKRMSEFKQRYRTTDILLLDDVQFFQGKEQILEEFFHTFNSLYESGKQLVISSDRHPRNLNNLEDRLRSRFEWGLITDIQPPDIETRLAILRRNAEFAPQPVPHDVLGFIASLVSDNIRELEGALTRVTAFASLTNQEISLPMAERVLQDLLPGHEAKAVDATQIIRATATAFGYTVTEITGPSRKQPLALARQVAMYLCREFTDLSLPKIGSHFGDRDHTTVIHAIDKIKRVLRSDRAVFDRVSELSQQLRKTG